MGYMAKGQKEQVVLVEWELRPPSIRMFECQPCHMATNADERRRDDPGADFLKRAMRENRRSSVPTFDRRNRCLPQSSFAGRSEEHTSELQSLMRTPSAVFSLKKKKGTKNH